MNRLWEFHQIYNFGAFGENDILIRFKVKKAKIKVTARQRMVK